MGLKTRLDGRSKDNNSFQIKDNAGFVVAEVKLLDSNGVNLEVSTEEGMHLEKPSGWTSQRK